MLDIYLSKFFNIINGKSIDEYKFGYIDKSYVKKEQSYCINFSYESIFEYGEKFGLIYDLRENLFFVAILDDKEFVIIAIHYSINDIIQKYKNNMELISICKNIEIIIKRYTNLIDHINDRYIYGLNRKDE